MSFSSLDHRPSLFLIKYRPLVYVLTGDTVRRSIERHYGTLHETLIFRVRVGVWVPFHVTLTSP